MEHKHDKDDGCNCEGCDGNCGCNGRYGYGYHGAMTALRVIFGVIVFVAAIILIVRAAYVIFGVAAGTTPALSLLWVFLGFVALAIFASIVGALLRWPWHGRHGQWDKWDMGGERATRILRRRYARGEITEVQFRRMTKTLNETRK